MGHMNKFHLTIFIDIYLINSGEFTYDRDTYCGKSPAGDRLRDSEFPAHSKERRYTMRGTYFGMASLLVLFCVFGIENRSVVAETYPEKPITMIIPSEAGSGADMLARKLIPKASQILGQPIMIVNKTGAGGSLAMRELHDAKPDGYTLGGFTPIIITNKLQGITPFNYSDFSVIGSYYFSYSWIIASTKTQRLFKTLEETVSFAKTNPGKVILATSGVGYFQWIAAVAFQQKTGVKFNILPQPGTAAMTTTQVAGGHADIGVTAMSPTKPLVDSGLVKLLAFFGPKRAPGFENVPALSELGYDVGVGAFGVFVGPRKLPKEIIDKLDKAFRPAVNDPEYETLCKEGNYTPLYLSPDKFQTYLDEQNTVFRSVMKEGGILREK